MIDLNQTHEEIERIYKEFNEKYQIRIGLQSMALIAKMEKFVPKNEDNIAPEKILQLIEYSKELFLNNLYNRNTRMKLTKEEALKVYAEIDGDFTFSKWNELVNKAVNYFMDGAKNLTDNVKKN